MVFGEHVHAPASSAAADAVVAACRGAWSTVGWFVPAGHARCVRLAAPDPDAADWWDQYRALFGLVAAVGAAHTSTPDRAWFGIWEGYGWDTSTTVVATADAVDRQELERLRAAARADDVRRRELVRTGLRAVPRFELPNRTYYLVTGAVGAITELREPGAPERWQRPDLCWPDDRAWHVATDVDFWSLYVAGSDRFVADVLAAVPVPAEEVGLDTPLAAED